MTTAADRVVHRYLDAVPGEDSIPLKQTLLVIRSIAMRTVRDLQADPDNIPVALTHLSDIVTLVEQAELAADG